MPVAWAQCSALAQVSVLVTVAPGPQAIRFRPLQKASPSLRLSHGEGGGGGGVGGGGVVGGGVVGGGVVGASSGSGSSSPEPLPSPFPLPELPLPLPELP